MKTFQKNGKWIEKTSYTPVLVCSCGYKYIKTRTGQATCIKCFMKQKILK